MKKLRPTQSFAPIGSEDSLLDDEMATVTKQATQSTSAMDRINKQFEGLEILENGLTSSMPSYSELPDNPPSFLPLAAPSPQATPRTTGTFAPRPTGTAALADPSSLEQLYKMTHDALVEKARELFVATHSIAQELLKLLTAFEEDKTPTQAPSHPDKTKQRFRRNVKELSETVKVANQEAERLGLSTSALTVFNHRQMKEYAQALEVYDFALARREGGQAGAFTPNEILRASLKKIIDTKESIRHRR